MDTPELVFLIDMVSDALDAGGWEACGCHAPKKNERLVWHHLVAGGLGIVDEVAVLDDSWVCVSVKD